MATVNEKMTAIADAIRAKTGGTELLTLDDMATDIPKVFDAGKQTQYDEFWDNYMSNVLGGGNVEHMFSGPAWNSDTFYPKYNIVPKGGVGVFYKFSWWRTPYIDLAQRLEECGVALDTSECSGFGQMFSYAFVTRLPKISILKSNSLDRTFDGAQVLVSIDELELKADGTNTFSNTFRGCSGLRNIVITGVIGNNGFNVSPCTKLTRDSILGKVATEEQITNGKNLVELNGTHYYGGIFGALKDYSDSGATYTLTLGTTNLAKLTDEEKALATQKGWTLA